ncbi:MAG: cupredoxin domain-containing protein [Myxococcales bacterium]|nr:cupredoxin domain-containing protein [Myxococcales bacterium]MCB9545492.1 cupredoxin domain-containing protein [Myxococcales bacterium]
MVDVTEGAAIEGADIGIQSLSRCDNGVDTDDNAADFLYSPVPTAGAANFCPPPPVEVAIENFDMNPNVVEISVGTTVRWTNLDANVHTVTSGAPGAADGIFDSGNLLQGETFEFTFLAPGVYTYFCQPHQGFMFGYEVRVAPLP